MDTENLVIARPGFWIASRVGVAVTVLPCKHATSRVCSPNFDANDQWTGTNALCEE